MKIFICMFLAAAAFAAKPVELKSSQLEVTFDPLKGLRGRVPAVLQQAHDSWRRGQRSHGDHLPRQSSPVVYLNFAVRPESDPRQQDRHADFQFTARERCGTAMAPSFMLRYELSGAELQNLCSKQCWRSRGLN